MKKEIKKLKEDYPTYHKTIVNSDIWQEWAEHCEETLEWDIWGSIETNRISPEHWESFLEWYLKTKNNEKII